MTTWTLARRSCLALAVATGAVACDASRKERAAAPAEAVVEARARRSVDGDDVALRADAGASQSGQPLAAPPRTIEPPPPARVESLPVEGDLPASIVRSLDGRPPRIVFFPGICSNAGAYLYGFAETARAHGGALAIDGDRSCGNQRDFHSITSDPAHEEPRIRAALAAAGATEEDDADRVWVGYSLGATLIENLVKKSPERYRRVVLIGSPRDPRKDRLGGALQVATLSCSLDVPGRMKRAAEMLTQAGISARYFEMPGCTHGNLAEGDRVFGEVFDWFAAARPSP